MSEYPPKYTTQVLTDTATALPPIHIRSQEIGSSRGPIGHNKVRNAHQLKTSIHQFSPEHSHPTPIFSEVIGHKTVPDKRADVYTRKWMDFGSNSVLSESPNFMDFGLLPTNKRDKLKSIIVHTTKIKRVTNGSKRLKRTHDISEITAKTVSKKKRKVTFF